MNTIKGIRTLFTIAVLAMAVMASSTSVAEVVGELGILDVTANGGINPNTGLPWAVGDQYRLAFHTDATINAISNDPAVYDDFVTAQAALNPALVGSTWTAMLWVNTDGTQEQGVGPISSPLDRSGTSDQTGGAGIGGAGVPVYAMDGTTCIARNNADIYNGWSNPFDNDTTLRLASGSTNLDSDGNPVTASQSVHYSPFLDQYGLGDTANVHGADVWTGGFGGHVNAAGDTPSEVRTSHGSSNANNAGRTWNRFNRDNTDSKSLYAISEILTIESGDPTLPTVVIDTPGKYTWSGQEVALDATVTNNAGDPNFPETQPPLVYSWTAEPNGIGDPGLDVVITGDTSEDAAITITKNTNIGDVVQVEVTLSVVNEGIDKPAKSASIIIDVYDNACLMGKDLGLIEIDSTDMNADCVTNLADFVLLAMDWMVDYAITAPVEK